jgi:protein involved in polysaccharide export with SLBB domain
MKNKENVMKKMLVKGISAVVLLSAWVVLAGASTLEIVDEGQKPAGTVDTQALPPDVQKALSLSGATSSSTNAVPPDAQKTAAVSAPGATEKAVVSSTPGLLEPATSGPGAVQKTGKKTRPMPPPIIETNGEPTTYTLGPDDVIEIVVRRHEEFSGTYPINAEGKIQYKFVGDIEVKGLTKNELKDKLIEILSKYIISPDVDVTIIEYRSKVIYVIGEVGAPGKYYMKADKISLREAVVQAGLPTLNASMRRTVMVRPDKSKSPKSFKVDLYALLYEGRMSLDLEMLPGDVVYVPATLFAKIGRLINPVAQPIYVAGEFGAY